MGCPPDTTYTGSNAEYSCVTRVEDSSGHIAWVRRGNSGWGYDHFHSKHKLDLQPVVATIHDSYEGVLQDNGRYLYEAYYTNSKGTVTQYVLVYESRSNAPVGHEMGVWTAYCQGRGHKPELTCPEWVNKTL